VKYDSENAKVQRRNSSSCLSDGDRTISHGRQDVFPAFCGHCTQDYSHLSDFVDYMKGPNYVMDEESFNIHYRDLMVNNSYSYHTKTSVKEKPNEEDIDIVDSLKNFLPSRGNHLSRPVIPIGPRFQAEVPKWEATTNIKQYNNDDCLKWLGTQIWPMSTICKSTAKGIEKGIFDSCQCCNRELVDCVDEKHNGEA
jgi:DNA gyrase subunit B